MASQPPHPETINRLTDDVTYAMAMLAGMQLDIFTPLKDGARTAEQIAASLDVQPNKLRPLLRALAAAGFVTIAGDRFSNAPEAQRYLVDGEPDSMLGGTRQLAYLWTELLGTAESIRTGVPQSMVDYATMSEQRLQAAYDRMYPQSEAAVLRLLEKHDFSAYRRLADVGGGHGAVAITMTVAYPNLKATVIDLSSVIPFTQRYIERAGVGDRVDVQAVDASSEPLSGSFDLAIMRSFIQVLTTDQAQQALKNIAQVIEPGGVIYVWGAGILDDSMVSPPAAVRYGLATLNRLDGTHGSTENEHREWLSDAGFVDFSREVLPNSESIITARKPA